MEKGGKHSIMSSLLDVTQKKWEMEKIENYITNSKEEGSTLPPPTKRARIGAEAGMDVNATTTEAAQQLRVDQEEDT